MGTRKTNWALYDGMTLIASGESVHATEAIIRAALNHDPAPEEPSSAAGDRVRDALRADLRWMRGSGARVSEGRVGALKGWAS